MYARKLTKEELMKSGITTVTEDGHVFNGELEMIPTINKQGYLIHNIYEVDENNQRIRIPNKKSGLGYYYKNRSIGLHRLMWAWHYGEVPEGLVVDHINNKHHDLEDYDLSNLQLLTARENTNKDRKDNPNWNTYELKCKLNKPRSFYEDKLTRYTERYEEAKKLHDAELAHKLRGYISQTRARLRYYDNHIDKYLEEAKAIQAAIAQKEAEKKARQERAQKKRELKQAVDSAHRYYAEVKNAYGKNDPIALKLCGEWKYAIAEYYAFCEEIKKS